jgi:hypothetical protein
MSNLVGMIRIGDREREEAAERLSAHAATGRLSVEELEQRLEAAQRAVYASDLEALERDLPGRRPAATVDRRWVPAARDLGAWRPAPYRAWWPALPLALVVLGVAATVAVGHPVAPLFFGLFLLWRLRFAWHA